MAESPYSILGVAKDASSDVIRKAYRKLARTHHPDVNPGDQKAEEAFKRISTAYEVISDDKKRAAYDEFGDASLHGGFDAEKAREHAKWQDTRQRRASRFRDEAPVEFDFGELFGRQRGPTRGADLQAAIEIDLRQAVEGSEFAADIPGQGNVRVRIPKGADSGSTLRVPGKGGPGHRGGPPGDLVIETRIRPHPHLRRDGLDLHLVVPVTLDEAYSGASLDIPTFEGMVVLKVPPRTQNHTKLRLRGKGVARKDLRGDLIVELDVRLPDLEDAAFAEAARKARELYSQPVRQEIAL